MTIDDRLTHPEGKSYKLENTCDFEWYGLER